MRDALGFETTSTVIGEYDSLGAARAEQDLVDRAAFKKKRTAIKNLRRSVRTKEELLDERANSDACACGVMFREKVWESSPGWWTWGEIREGSTVFTLMRRGPAGRDEPYTRRYCPKCSIAIFDTLLTLGLDPRPHLDARKVHK